MDANPFLTDAQGALSFLSQQAAYVETEVFRTKYEDIQYPQLVTIDTSAGEFSKVIEFYSMDGVGKAKWFNHLSKDVPNADVNMTKYTHAIEMAAIGYRYTTEELGYASRLGISLDTERASMARRAYEEFIDDIVRVGDTDKGMTGLFNDPNVDDALVANDGTGSTRTWATKTPIQILRDVNEALTAVYAGSGRVEMANTILLPTAAFTLLATTPMSADSNMTILDWLMRGNVYTATTGQPLTIRAVGGLEDAGASGAGRMVVYRNTRDVVKLHLPVPLRFLEPMRSGPMIYEVPGYFKTGGVEIRLPGAVRYRDGIVA
ncbi:DUF2184 domain-containing protein [Sphingomonas baiyangensis]|nr:DUF2184 domain-containing protein [Sphingomonas baiyangensis]